MSARDDILAELHLLPQWRRRARPGLGSAPEAAVPGDAVAAPVQALIAATTPMAAAESGRPVMPILKPAIVPITALAPAATPADDAARLARIGALMWPEFAADVDACTACGLCRTRKRSVPGVGDVDAEWLFVGEAPGAEEDATGEPFVGQAGRLLDNMLFALGLARGKGTYIANVMKCRPPGNRTPEPREVAACMPYLDRQIALIRPKLIVALGKSAAAALLGIDATIASLRGRVHRFRDLPLIVTYHPAYLLRNLPDKSKSWEDLLFARRTMAQTRPEP